MGAFDDILQGIPAEDRAILDKYPELRTRMEELERFAVESSRYASQWLGWRERNWDDATGMTKAEKELRDQLAAANARLEGLTMDEGSASDFDERGSVDNDIATAEAELASKSEL